MFVALKNDTSNTVDDMAIESLFLENMDHTETVTDLLTEISSLSDTAHNLILLRDTIEKNGITKSLLDMTNADGMLSKYIPAIPSLESFTADIAPGADSAIAVEALSDHISKIMAVIKEKFAKFVHALFESYSSRKRVVRAVLNRAMVIKNSLHGKVFSEERAESIRGNFISLHSLMKNIDTAMNVHGIFHELYEIPLPETREEKTEFDRKVLEFTAKVRSEYLVEGHNKAFQGKIEQKKQSLKEAGYTASSLEEITTKLEAYATHFDKESNIMEADEDLYWQKADDMLKNISGKDKAINAGKIAAQLLLGNIAGSLARTITTASDRIYEACVKVMTLYWKSTWSAWKHGPAYSIAVLKALSRAYV